MKTNEQKYRLILTSLLKSYFAILLISLIWMGLEMILYKETQYRKVDDFIILCVFTYAFLLNYKIEKNKVKNMWHKYPNTKPNATGWYYILLKPLASGEIDEKRLVKTDCFNNSGYFTVYDGRVIAWKEIETE